MSFLRIFALCLLPFNLFALSWQNTFFTDDSPYYLKLKKGGFIQRFRVDQSACHQIQYAEVVTQSNKKSNPRSFRKLSGHELQRWPNLYGPNATTSCWFQVDVNGLNFNNPQETQYIIKLHVTGEEDPYFFGGIVNTIIPSQRIYHRTNNIPWIQLGQSGATPVIGGGVFYKIWEPIADEVHLFIDDRGPIKMIPDSDEFGFNSKRSHVVYMPQARIGSRYHFQFMKNGAYEILPMNDRVNSPVKVDPMAKQITYLEKGGKHNNYVQPRAIVTQETEFPWMNDQTINGLPYFERDNWIIYQIWPLTFNPKKRDDKWLPGTFNTVAEKLDYITDLGVNAVEFMPVHESRFYASWGYAADSISLIEKVLGTPDELKSLIDKLHGRGIRVIFDVVINHINNQLIRDPLTAENLHSKFFNGVNWGPKPRFESPMVRKWIADSLIGLMRDYHLDGFRFDMLKYVYMGSEAGYKFLQELNILFKQVNPNFYSTAEELPDNVWTTYSTTHNGLGFDAQWNDLFKNFFEKEFRGYTPYSRSIDLRPLHGALLGFSNHISYGSGEHFGAPNKTINYLGSHDFIGNEDPIIRIVSGYHSEEQDAHNSFKRVRPLTEPFNKEEVFRIVHNSFTHDVGRLAYSILFTKPGGVLFYQGEELAQDLNIENEWSYLAAQGGNAFPSKNVDMDRFINSHRMPWEFLTPGRGELSFLNRDEYGLFLGYHKFFKEMIRFKRTYPELNATHASNVQVFNNQSIISYELNTGVEKFFVVINFGYEEGGTWVHFPGNNKTWWEEVFNSSDPVYGGKTSKFLNVISQKGGRMNQVRLHPSSFSLFKMKQNGSINRNLYLRGNHSNWSAGPKDRLNPIGRSGNTYYTVINVENNGDYEFKVASSDWQIEMGVNPTRGDGLSYLPGQPNIRRRLDRGTYKFFFNLETFQYQFQKQ